MRTFIAVLIIVALGAHVGLGWVLHKQRPELGILPAQPNDAAAAAMALGDKQFLYRAFVLQLQNAGDTGGRFTPMNQYDIPAVVSWLQLLQRLDQKGQHHTALAARYFVQLQQSDNLRLLINFIDEDVALSPNRKWYWQTQAVALARDRLKDLPFALELARKMRGYVQYVPEGLFWMFQMEPILLEDMGRYDDARIIMEEIVAQYGYKMNDTERAWTASFFQRLNR